MLGYAMASKVILPWASDSPVATVSPPSLTVNLKPERSMDSGLLSISFVPERTSWPEAA